MENRARTYHRWQLILACANVGVTVGVLGLATWATGWCRPAAVSGPGALVLAVAARAIGLGLAVGVAAAPLAVAAGYWLPRRFGLLHQPFHRWLADRVKAGVIGGVLGLAAVEVVYLLLWTTSLWWLAAAAIFLVAYGVLAMVAPVWLLPLFYRVTPLADRALADRLVGLADRAGVPVIGVWVADQSRKSKTANAALTGIGRTRRVILFDTLLAQFTPEEIESVLAHELGHHVHGDIRRGLGMEGLLTLVTFWVTDRLLRIGVTLFGLHDMADPTGLPWLALVLTVLGLVAAPLGNAFSRLLERQADDFAVRTTGNAGAFVAAMERLATLNLAERRPHPVKELLLYSHPSIDRRIARAQHMPAGA